MILHKIEYWRLGLDPAKGLMSSRDNRSAGESGARRATLPRSNDANVALLSRTQSMVQAGVPGYLIMHVCGADFGVDSG